MDVKQDATNRCPADYKGKARSLSEIIACRDQQRQARLIMGKKESPGGRRDTITRSQMFSCRSKS